MSSSPVPFYHPEISQSQALYAGEQVAQRLRSLSIAGGPSSLATQFYTRIRVKTAESIREKIRRNQQESQPSFGWSDIDDLVGFRIVTLYDAELCHIENHNAWISPAINCVFDLIHSGQQSSQPLFRQGSIWDSFNRAKFLQRTPFPDDVYARCHEAITTKIVDDCKLSGTDAVVHNDKLELRPFDPKKSEYSSAHLTFEAIAYTQTHKVLIPVEFQIRNVAEDI